MTKAEIILELLSEGVLTEATPEDVLQDIVKDRMAEYEDAIQNAHDERTYFHSVNR